MEGGGGGKHRDLDWQPEGRDVGSGWDPGLRRSSDRDSGRIPKKYRIPAPTGSLFDHSVTVGMPRPGLLNLGMAHSAIGDLSHHPQGIFHINTCFAPPLPVH